MPTTSRADEPVPRSAWGLLLFLTALNILNFVDRMLIASLAPLLINDLGLSRAQIGLLAGFGFVFFYTFVGLFLGMAADRFRRLPLIGAGVALWSAMTALSGLARSFMALAIPRIFVGVGEATLTPAAISMLGDAFPPRRLGLAIGVYYAGIPLGLATALISSSYHRAALRLALLASSCSASSASSPPALLFLFREPARRSGCRGRANEARPALARDRCATSAARSCERPALALALLGGSLLCYGSGAALLGVTWLVEERGFAYADAAFRAGIVAVFAGFLGNLAGGAFGDFCARRFRAGTPLEPGDHDRGPRHPGVALLLDHARHAALLRLLAHHQRRHDGVVRAALLRVSGARARAHALDVVAFALLVLNLLGVGPGPLITGMIGDRADSATACSSASSSPPSPSSRSRSPHEARAREQEQPA